VVVDPDGKSPLSFIGENEPLKYAESYCELALESDGFTCSWKSLFAGTAGNFPLKSIKI